MEEVQGEGGQEYLTVGKSYVITHRFLTVYNNGLIKESYNGLHYKLPCHTCECVELSLCQKISWGPLFHWDKHFLKPEGLGPALVLQWTLHGPLMHPTWPFIEYYHFLAGPIEGPRRVLDPMRVNLCVPRVPLIPFSLHRMQKYS